MAETTTVRETERKYSGEPVDADLAGVLARAAAEAMHGCAGPPREPAELALSAVYFDTEDLRLARSGITLRRRSGGTDDGWHLKLPAGSDARDEVRLPPGELGAPPAPLVALTRATHRGAPLVPVVELDTARREWVLADSDGHPLATVTDDRVTGQTLAAPTMVTRCPARGRRRRRSRGRGAGLRRGAGRRDPGDGPSRAPECPRFRARHAGGMPSDAKHYAVVSRGAGARPHRSPR